MERHFTATGIVFNANREVLMIRHKKLGVWLPPGGHIEANEAPEAAAIREIFEETGVVAEVIPNKILSLSDQNCTECNAPFVILSEDVSGDGSHIHIDLVYLLKAVGEEILPEAAEVSDAKWFAVDEVKTLETFPNVIREIELAFCKEFTEPRGKGTKR